MSKVYDYYNQHNSEDPCCPSVMETSDCECGQSEPTEPTDAELMDIETNIDDMFWDDDYEN